jgi:hypothetical protein
MLHCFRILQSHTNMRNTHRDMCHNGHTRIYHPSSCTHHYNTHSNVEDTLTSLFTATFTASTSPLTKFHLALPFTPGRFLPPIISMSGAALHPRPGCYTPHTARRFVLPQSYLIQTSLESIACTIISTTLLVLP